MEDGTVIHMSSTKVKVQVEGARSASVGERLPKTYALPTAFDGWMEFVARDVLPSLEPLLPP